MYHGMIYRGIGTSCHECPDRYPACHDKCEKYQQARAEWLEFKKNVRKNKRLYKDYDGFKIKAMERIRK